jgi:hypothetical protein
MTIVSDLINDALTMIGVLAAGEAVAPEDSALALRVLNRLLDSWSAEKVALLGLSYGTYALNGAASYTIGTGGAFNATRPLAIRSVSTILTNGVEIPAKLVSAEEWAAIPDKTRTGLAIESVFYDGGYATARGTLYVTPKPAAGNICFIAYTPVAQFASVNDAVAWAAGYERPFIYCLAADLAPAYGLEISPSLAGLVTQSKNVIASLTAETLRTQPPPQPKE